MKVRISQMLKLFAFGILIPLSWTPAEGATINVACPGATIQAAIDAASPGDTISVTGTCTENIIFRNEKQRIALDGGNVATIIGTSGGGNQGRAVTIRGKGITVQNFTITGGSHGVHVNRGSNATINHNIIQNSNNNGILIDQFSFAIITNNTISGHGSNGISIRDASSARIGFNLTNDVSASPNTVQNNGDRGIVVTRAASAEILGNVIQNNASDGIGVFRNAQADISSNTINGNGTAFQPGDTTGNGLAVGQNSSVQLGEDNPTTFMDQPNITTVNNANAGIRCTQGSNVRGHLGSTNQLNGAVSQFGGGTTANTFSGNCHNAATGLDTP